MQNQTNSLVLPSKTVKVGEARVTIEAHGPKDLHIVFDALTVSGVTMKGDMWSRKVNRKSGKESNDYGTFAVVGKLPKGTGMSDQLDATSAYVRRVMDKLLADPRIQQFMADSAQYAIDAAVAKLEAERARIHAWLESKIAWVASKDAELDNQIAAARNGDEAEEVTMAEPAVDFALAD